MMFYRNFRLFLINKFNWLKKVLKTSKNIWQLILEKLLVSAKNIGSSDIHFEPYETRCRVRFRLDGKLKEYYIISLDEYPVIINKIKIKAGLDISEKRLPQDGRITIKTNNDEFDIRVSTLPTLHGERSEERRVGKECRSRWEAEGVKEET